MNIYLNSPGCKLSIEANLFVIRTEDEKKKIAANKIESIWVTKGTNLSSDALMYAVEREIPVLLIEKNGKPMARVWSNKYGSISTIRKNQLKFSNSPQAVEWVKKIIIEKIENQKSLLLTFSPYSLATDTLSKAENKLKEYSSEIAKIEATRISSVADKIRSLEANASRQYFKTINQCLPEQYKFKKRSQHPALDSYNALLNYAYGMLYGLIEGALIKAGIDPYIGIFHRDDYNKPVLVYDFIEKYRVWADFVVADLCMQQVIYPDFFDIKKDGSYYLENEGKKLLIQSMNDYLDEKISMDNKILARKNHLQNQAILFAQELKTFKG